MPYGDIKLRQNEDTETRLARLNGELREASAQTILRVAMIREWPEELTYVSSFGAESVAMLALIADVDQCQHGVALIGHDRVTDDTGRALDFAERDGTQGAGPQEPALENRCGCLLRDAQGTPAGAGTGRL